MNNEILNYEDFVRIVLEALESAGAEYMIGGAVAAWAWGEPRSTLALDLVVNIPLEVIGRLSSELKKRDMLVPEDIILNNILENRADLPINAIHMFSGYKADLYPVREGDELRAVAFSRRKRIDLGEPFGDVYLHSPEDLIIYKLWYYSISQQSKHIRDITGIVKSLGDDLDFNYVKMWAIKKGISNIWEELIAKIQSKN